AHRVGVVGGDQDGVLPLLHQRVDVGDLRGGGGVGRADLLGLALVLLGGGDAGLIDQGEVGVVDLLGQEGQLDALLERRVRVGRGGGGGLAATGVHRVLGGAAAGGHRQRHDPGGGHGQERA